MLAVILALLIVPVSAAVISIAGPARQAAALTVASGLASFALVLALIPRTAHRDLSYLSGYIRVDAVSVIFLLATGFLYAAVAIYSVGYLHGHGHFPGQRDRRFYAGLNMFAWAMLAAPLMGSLALLWIGARFMSFCRAWSAAAALRDRGRWPTAHVLSWVVGHSPRCVRRVART